MWRDATFFVFASSPILRIIAGKSVDSVLPNPFRKIGKIKAAEEE